MNIERITGFFLVLLGLSIIAFALFSSLRIFTGKANPPQVFSFESTQQTPSPKSKDISIENIQGITERVIQDQLQNIIPQDTVSRMLNFTAWSFLAGLLMLGGSQVASLGIKLIRAGKEHPQQT